MRHLKAGRALGVTSAHRRAMLRNLVTSLIEKEQIRTTVARAKELRKPLDKMITLGKRGDLHARRQALTFVKSKEAMANLFGDFAERYKDRDGGFSRILKLGPRRGDGAEMAVVVLVGSPEDPMAEAAKPARRRRGGAKKTTEVITDVASEVRAEAGTTEEAAETTEAAPETVAEATEAAAEEAPASDATAAEEEAKAKE